MSGQGKPEPTAAVNTQLCGPEGVDEEAGVVSSDAKLRTGLESRHMQMIAIGSCSTTISSETQADPS